MSTYSQPTYTPTLPDYQSSVPLELMTKVGMYKQAKYDANKQNTQDQIDKIGQLQIVKDSDKAVITDKMNQLVSNLNEFSNQDLGDSRVASQLMAHTSSFFNDKDVYERVADNQRAVRAMGDYEKMIKDDPTTYGANNSKLFLKQYNDWMNTPGKKFNGQYNPYYDYTKEENEIIDRVKKDPNVTTKVLSNGQRVPLAYQELTQVLPTKIHEALMSSLSGNALKQYQIDWEGQKDNYTVQGTVGDINKEIESLATQRAAVEARIKTAKTTKDREDDTALLSNIDSVVTSLKEKQGDIISTNDPSVYHTFNSYINKRLRGLGEAYAFKKEGKIEWDPYELEKVKHQYAMAEKKKGEEGTIYATPFENSLKVIGYNGEGQMVANEMTHLIGGSSKANEDGTFTLPLHNKNLLFDPRPTLKAAGMDVDARKVLGTTQVRSDYKAWTQTPGGQNQVADVAYTPDGIAIDAGTRAVPKSFAEYAKLASSTIVGTNALGKPMTKADKYRNEFGLDLNNPDDMNVANRINEDPSLLDKFERLTKGLKGNLAGTFKAVPGEDNNVVVGSEGKLYANVLLQIPRNTLLAAMNEGGMLRNTGFNELVDKGVLKNMHVKDEKGNDMYQLSSWVPANPDLQLSHDNYTMNNSSKKDGLDAAGEHRKPFAQTMADVSTAKPFIQFPDEMGKGVKDYVTKIVGSSPFAESLNQGIDQAILKIKDKTVPVDKKEEFIKDLVALTQAQSKEDIIKILSR